ncbi:MAG: PD-(D/E)XK nuclease family protein [Oscillospiraceae bacterium]|nr:PD-(D/E)XK nuclease family protein [Oscillospiraceae bacterium]
MLRIVMGKAGTGKSSAIMGEIASAVEKKQGGCILLVPEQFSHEAERELCERCGDSLSLYAEVLSFTGLARKLTAELGGGAAKYLDKGGRLLCMALAAEGLYSRLRVYSSARKRAELQLMLLSAVDELKAACVGPEQLNEAAAACGGALSEKLHDLALVMEAYDAVVANGHADPTDRLSILAQQIEHSSLGGKNRIYIDGFTDFTAQERRVLEALLLKNAELTLCISCDSLEGGSEIFELGRMTLRSMLGFCRENNIRYDIQTVDGEADKNSALRVYADNMFSYSAQRSDCDEGVFGIHAAGSAAEECELAAARCIELVREKGCRWRDIAVAVRGFEDYRLLLESVFAHYGVPLYTARKSDLMSKPLPALISGVYEIIGGGWEISEVMAYLRTGLAGLGSEECDELENYLLLWQLRGNAWKQENDWRLHPEGYGGEYTQETEETLRRINSLRRKAAAPLLRFEERSGAAASAFGQAEALAELLEELELSDKLEKRADELEKKGHSAAAREYAQLWDITVSALEQSAAILGDAEFDRDSFGRLFGTMLTRYDVGTIPVSLDSVTAGDFDRMRRRKIKHLIVLGASDERIPAPEAQNGMFSPEERRQLLEMDIDLGAEGDVWREFSVIYNCLTLPSESLHFCYPAFGSGGDPLRPAFVVNRAKNLFSLETEAVIPSALRMNAPAPALELAANSLRGGGEAEASAAAYFAEREPRRLEALLRASEMSRGSLSRESVRALYGDKLRLSASRIDKFASCRFAYFMQYGLKARKREPAGFTPPEMGTFMHYILEQVAGEVMALGGFKKVEEDKLRELTDKYIAVYVSEKLNDFREKSPRFEYLFRRLTRDVRAVVSDMAGELRASEFEPLSFELDFGRSNVLPPYSLGEGEENLILTGVADRVDGWVHEGKLYVRVMDYKTGRKKFSLPDVWCGMGLQMLLYLFSLGENGKLLYGREIVPAGVMYIPARDVLLSETSDLSDEEIAEKKAKSVQRSGLLLDDVRVLRAMEQSEKPKYIPVTFKDGVPTGKSLAGAERFGLLARHINGTLRDMAKELRQGSIAADPFYRNQRENACTQCDYFSACHFVNGENGEHIRTVPANLDATKVWSILEGGEDCG